MKFHPLYIVKGTMFYERWKAHEPGFRLMDLNEYVQIICDAIELLPASMIIQRLTGEAASDLLVAPEWVRNKNEVLNLIHAELKKRILNDKK
jgi:hypothetical protein